MKQHAVAIIGSGPAGYTAAIYAARADLHPLVFTGEEQGGQLMWTTEVENYPGFPKGIQGPELMSAMREQATRFGAQMIDAKITKIDLHASPFKLWSETTEYAAQSVIIATGASAKWLQLPNEQRLRGKGVSACATCDGFFFRGKDVVVVGGGDAAMEEATFLTKFATSVTILVRTEVPRASKAMLHRAQTNPKIRWMFSTVVADVLGQDRVEGVLVRHVQDDTEERLAAQGFFLAIGHQPNTQLFDGQLVVDHKGYLQVSEQVKTAIPGVFVAGDVADFLYRQAVTAAGWGCMAALEAERYLAHLHAGA